LISDLFPEKMKKSDRKDKLIYKFTLADRCRVNIDTGKVQQLRLPPMEFVVNDRGEFLKGMNTKEIAKDLIMKKRKELLAS
jgi:hypothetical protein